MNKKPKNISTPKRSRKHAPYRRSYPKLLLNHFLQWAWPAIGRHGAIGPDSFRAKEFGYFGEDTLIGFPLTAIHGQKHMRLGSGILVAPYATLVAGISPAHPPTQSPALILGDRCVIGIRSGIVAHHKIELGSDVWLGQNVFITDANHGYEDLTTPIGSQLMQPQAVSIGDQSWLGHGVVVLPGVTIGKHVVIAAGSVVTHNIPDFSVAAGVPARVLRTYNEANKTWEKQ